MAIFPADETGVGGALVVDPRLSPGGGSNSLIYLNAEGKLDAALSRVSAAGGEIVTPKTSIAPHGFIALVRDSEKNLVGLHSFN
jgi:predicted enzyme related to lactoylglutathione lyase